jgi:transcriptional regulator with XRE-family HTH domain
MSKKPQKRNGHGQPGHNSRIGPLYRSYVFKDKDPVIDKIRTMVQDEGIKETNLAIISGVSKSTLTNWFEGETKKPQYATIAAVTMAMGYVTDFVKEKKVNYAAEFKKASEEIAEAKRREERRLAKASA